GRTPRRELDAEPASHQTSYNQPSLCRSSLICLMSAPRLPLRMPDPQPLPRQRVAERVVDEIRAYIESNGLEAGAKLPPERGFIERPRRHRSVRREGVRVTTH